MQPREEFMNRAGAGPPLHSRLRSVDALRALAALAVVVVHIHGLSSRRGTESVVPLTHLLEFGAWGVPLFLVLSGFCIHRPAARGAGPGRPQGAGWGAFWRRRFWRLYPPYLAAIAFSLAVSYGTAWQESLGVRTPRQAFVGDLTTHLLLVHNLTTEYSNGLGNVAFWTLGLEEQLYALYALYLVLRRRWSAPCVAGIALAIQVVWAFAVAGTSLIGRWAGIPDGELSIPIGPIHLGHWAMWPPAYWFPWVLGAVAVEAAAGTIQLPRWCRRGWIVGGLFGLAVAVSPKLLIPLHVPFPGLALTAAHALSEAAFALAVFALLNRWVAAEDRGCWSCPRPLAALGLMSYSLYLVHLPALCLFEYLSGWQRDPAKEGLRLLVYTPACVAVAAVFFWTVERHFLRRAVPTDRAGLEKPLPQSTGRDDTY
jgi:peptidoglycan/LPS O-acetylase OafA/YrhL